VLERLVIAAASRGADVADVAAEFPTVAIVDARTDAGGRTVAIDLAAWTAPATDLRTIDARVGRAADEGAFGLRVEGDAWCARAGLEMLTRYQRYVGRRNRATATALWDGVRSRHRALHDLELPLVRADFEHAVDTWQWLLRLAPDAGFALQAAALFHDVERLESEAIVRVEQHAPSYDAFKDAHARRGAALMRAVLDEAGVDATTAERAVFLVERHERPGEDAELALLNEADALSFFSLNSAGFVDYYGPDHARMKIARSWARLRPCTRRRVSQIRFRPDVHALVQHALGIATQLAS
jgi:hypothetical protein